MWIQTDKKGFGCTVHLAYSVDSHYNHYRVTRSTSGDCSERVHRIFDRSGRLEFSDDNNVMIEYYDPVIIDSENRGIIIAFKWQRQTDDSTDL